MSENAIDRLTEIFKRFPGIGPRQAGRFVYYLLRSPPSLRRELVDAVRGIAEAAKQCPTCFRYHSDKQKECSVCRSASRDTSLLMVVASDADLSSLEHSDTYKGRYFVLGGTVALGTDKNPTLRTKELLASLPMRIETGLQEIILAFPANPEGDATAFLIRNKILEATPLGFTPLGFKITALGRGLSTGSELEYADPDTLRNALENRR
ncbi:hypothetical protein A2673_00545 [Candidatus Kaiserbacteria bacterium RIFCSPHIGHO2_01_FULL_50_13]|uniref:Recombination protein RecR n=1 Tax=Candidatus Kaiserbacteria bacterium RIFCSPLOWO2_01_FULL_50_24 TaxID=1798507 RepID=A0A1F6EMQ5_9BACT|nr:MAG: hypothetical protein A2673_00545 [Candidatus Kaiserbacteria bacterium RIFCSPHIGHO2_01_FULL_50_13]OGG74924.1 MAG: hypothetical protein A3A34_03855 [Candidatus Kaiserbacteria bacterium RIFCSPLOWO2_01_FULL_50_24]OGG82246.1 MAG: hypothetical protein A3H74_03560 [Candidatus Kaiserbacteria bacterium RIFCSPLOWO2_02_FULL_51_13]